MTVKRAIEIVVFIVGLCIPLSLGGWQIKRAAWKAEILSKLEREYGKSPALYQLQAHDFDPAPSGNFKVVRGHITGRFISDKTLYWPSIKEGNYVLGMMSPFLLAQGGIVMVDRGWVYEDLTSKRPLDVISHPVDVPLTIYGLARAREHNSFTFENDVAGNRWYRFQPEQIAAAYGKQEVLPLVFYAEAVTNNAPIFGDVENIRIYPRNNHMQYALFWFSMAGLWGIILWGRVFGPAQ